MDLPRNIRSKHPKNFEIFCFPLLNYDITRNFVSAIFGKAGVVLTHPWKTHLNQFIPKNSSPTQFNLEPIHPCLDSSPNLFNHEKLVPGLIHPCLDSSPNLSNHEKFIPGLIHPCLDSSQVWFILALIPPKSDSSLPWFILKLIYSCNNSSLIKFF